MGRKGGKTRETVRDEEIGGVQSSLLNPLSILPLSRFCLKKVTKDRQNLLKLVIREPEVFHDHNKTCRVVGNVI